MTPSRVMDCQDSGPLHRISLYRIPIIPKINSLFTPNAHYTKFGIMNTESGHYTETLFPLCRILIMPKKSNFGAMGFGVLGIHEYFSV